MFQLVYCKENTIVYSYKVALLIDENGFPVELAFIPGSYSDHSALAPLHFNLP